GRGSHEPLAYFDPDSSSWRTSPPTSGEGSTLSPKTWPRSGMTRHGLLFALPMLAPPIDANDCSSLLPTPLTSMKHGHGGKVNIQTVVVSLLPTPRASDGEKGGPNQRGSSGDPMLPNVVHKLLPTPTASEYGRNKSASPGAAVRPSLGSLVKELTSTGSSTPPQSADGRPSSESPRPARTPVDPVEV